MKLIKNQWDKLSIHEKEHPANPDEIFVCRGCHPGWPPYFVARAQGKKDPLDHEHLGLFWDWDTAVAFGKLAEEMNL